MLFAHFIYRVLLQTLSCLCLAGLSFSSLLSGAVVGETAPFFTQNTTHKKEFSLQDHRGRIVVLEWNNPSSPYVQKYYSKLTMNGVGYLQSLQKQYTVAPYNIIWVIIAPISSSHKDYLTAEKWAQTISEWSAAPSYIILDETGSLSKLYDIDITPQMCVIDAYGTLVYRGAIDSIQSSSYTDIEEINNIHWFRNAIDNVIKGRPVFTYETIPHGSKIEI